jgi:hypothetical protein
MRLTEERINQIIEGEIEDFFRNLNSQSDWKSWAETDAENGISHEEGRRQRFQPGNAACAPYIPSKHDFKLHTYEDWVKNYKPRGITYQQYREIEF